jgi:hypothetical protein
MSSAAIGDTHLAESRLEQYRAAADASRLSRFIWQGMSDSATLAALLGDIARSEIEAGEALEYARRSGLIDGGMGAYGAVIYNVRRAQGRASELIPLLQGLVTSQPGAPVWRIALAGAASFARRTDIAQEQFEWLTIDRCANIPNDVEFPVTVCGLARIAPDVDASADVAEFLYDALRPFAGTMNFTGLSISDANDVGLGCVAHVLGRYDAADAHFRDAVELAERARALPYELHYRYEWARSLEHRGRVAEAGVLAADVVERGTALGLDGPDGYVARAGELLAAMGG